MNKKMLDDLYGKNKNDILFYLRSHPEWYKILNRHPDSYNYFIKVSKEELKITFNHKIERFKNQVQILGLINEYMNRS